MCSLLVLFKIFARESGVAVDKGNIALIKNESASHPGTTVIVIAYNHGEFLRGCLESVRTQIQTAAHVIVVDDASPDNTAEVTRSYVDEFDLGWRLILNQDNRGLNRNLNRALLEQDTEFVTYISADDLMHLERIGQHEEILRVKV